MKKVYKFKLIADINIYDVKHDQKTLLGEWGILDSKCLRIKKGYAWDGCTPKFKLFGKVFGVWDGKGNCLKYASCVHDILCQFPNPFTRKEIDTIFLNMMKDVDFSFAKLYYYSVRAWSILRGVK